MIAASTFSLVFNSIGASFAGLTAVGFADDEPRVNENLSAAHWK